MLRQILFSCQNDEMLRKRVTVAVLLPVPWGLCGTLYPVWYPAMLPGRTQWPWLNPAPDIEAPFLWLCSHLSHSRGDQGSSCKHLRTKTRIQVLITGFTSLPCFYHFDLQMYSIDGCPSSFAFLLASSALNTVFLRVENKCLTPCL